LHLGLDGSAQGSRDHKLLNQATISLFGAESAEFDADSRKN